MAFHPWRLQSEHGECQQHRAAWATRKSKGQIVTPASIYIEREATRRLGEPQFQATGAFSKMGTGLLVSGYLRMGGVSGHRCRAGSSWAHYGPLPGTAPMGPVEVSQVHFREQQV